METILRGKMKAEPLWAGGEAVLMCGFQMLWMNSASATRFPLNKSVFYLVSALNQINTQK